MTLVFGLASALGAQELRIIVDKKGKVGFSDTNGNEIIKCQYESAAPFENGVAIVTKSKKSGMIDAMGNVLLPLKYSKITRWNDNLYLVTSGKKLGLVSNDGKVVLKPSYTQISKPNCYGRALIAAGGKTMKSDKSTYMLGAKYGIIDADGNVLVPAKYKALYEFAVQPASKFVNAGAALLVSVHSTTDTLITDCSYLGYNTQLSASQAGVMDGHGQVLLKNKKYATVYMPQSGMIAYRDNKNKKEMSFGYYNIETGKEIQVGRFAASYSNWTHGNFTGNIAVVNNGVIASFIDKEGKTIRTGYSEAGYNATSKLWKALNASQTWDIFDENGNDVTVLSGFESLLFPVGVNDVELFTVEKNAKSGCIDRNGNVAVPFEYDDATGLHYGVVGVRKGDKWGAVSHENKLVIPIEYTNFKLPNECGTIDFWVQKNDKLYYHLNTASGKLSDKGYPSVNNFHDGVAFVSTNDMKIRNTTANRALLFAPNTAKETIDAAIPQSNVGSFGYIVDTEDNVLMDIPVSNLYFDRVTEELRKFGTKKLTSADKKRIILNVTRDNRTYDLKSVLDEDEWDY